MSRVLIAGVGNVFFGDDAFGVEVVQRLASAPPPGAVAADFGIRSVHLAFELLVPTQLLIIVDCMPRGGPPGTIYVLEPELDGPTGGVAAGIADAHGMHLPLVFSAVRELGGCMPPTRVVGCEPATTDAGIGLSPRVATMIPAAIAVIHDLVATHQLECP